MSVQRSEIYFVNLNPVQGREQAGERPVLVLSVDAINQLPLVVTVVVGTKGTNITKNYPTNVRCLPDETITKCDAYGERSDRCFLVPNWLNVQLLLPLGQGLFPTLFPLLGKERLCSFTHLKSLGDRL